MAIVDTLRLIGVPGSNKVMGGELSRLTGRALSRFRLPNPRKAGTGILVYPFHAEVARVAAYYHRTASRLLWDVCESRATRLEPLFDELRAAVAGDTRGWLFDGATFSIRARNVGAFAAGERQIVGAVKNAIVDGAAARGLSVSVDSRDPDVHVSVRMHDEVVTVSVDLVGKSMHERGYRREAGVAPLRENLAAMLVMLSRFDARREVLVDPMTGSGTIAIEAALMATAEPLWRGAYSPALHRLPAFADVAAAGEPLFPDTRPRILASDVSAVAVELAKKSAEAAGVADRIHIERADARDLDLAALERALGRDAGPGVIVANPPYGERLDVDVDFYAELGEWCQGLRGWRAAFLVANPEFEEAFGVRPRVKKPLSNASQKSYFYMYDF